MTLPSLVMLENPPGDMAGKIGGIFLKAGIKSPFTGSPDGAAIIISWPGEKTESDEKKMYAGGFMTCPNAFKAAAKIGLDRSSFGELLNLLDIKLRQCQFGCF